MGDDNYRNLPRPVGLGSRQLRPCGAPASGWNVEFGTYCLTRYAKSSHSEIDGAKRISRHLSRVEGVPPSAENSFR